MPKTSSKVKNQATDAAAETLSQVRSCIDRNQSFLVEAGAGAGKTYSLVEALRYVIEKRGRSLQRRSQQVACITYTNVASEEIDARTDRHPVIASRTIHAFCWSVISSYQSALRHELSRIEQWQERLADTGGIGNRSVAYSLGYPVVEEDRVLLHHNDVLVLMVALLENEKFRRLFADRYPVLFIDEYQDTDRGFAEALAKHYFGAPDAPMIGLFGDHWQKIYGTGCGRVTHTALTVIGKKANFRSASAIVDVLNRMRPELPQLVPEAKVAGSAEVYHTNAWSGNRRTDHPWKGDLPPKEAHYFLDRVKEVLIAKGWDFDTPNASKILMLTHRLLATEQGYDQLLALFPNNEAVVRAEDPYLAFFREVVEPVCKFFERKSYGELFALLNQKRPTIRSHADKAKWHDEMCRLVNIRTTGTIADVMQHIASMQLKLPNAVVSREVDDVDADTKERVDALKRLPYSEVIALANFIDGYTPFATKHGVKGAEFDNVLVIVGRGWNQYDFNQMLGWYTSGVPKGKEETFERNRNLFYVACSRPKQRLAVLFTQLLDPAALETLETWYGSANVRSL